MSAHQAGSNEPHTDSMSEKEKEIVQDHAEKKPHVNPAEEDDSMMSAGNIRVCIVQAIGGSLNGYSIGFVGVYSTLYGMSTNCASYRFESGCSTVPNANCKWYTDASLTAGGYCGWAEGTCSRLYPNLAAGGTDNDAATAACNNDKNRCAWSYSSGECQNLSGYSSSDNGIFAGSMIAGCLIGSIFAGPLATAIGAKISFLLVGIVGVVSSVMYHVSCAENEFWVLIVGRFAIGLFMGVIGVACPMYTDQNAHPKWKRSIGCMFQVFTTFGIFIAATMGLSLGQSVYFDRDKDQKLMARMQGICAVSTLLSIVMIGLGVYVTDSRAKFDGGDDEDAVELDPNEYSYLEMLPRLGMGLVMAGTLQLTGINAVMNYAPTIMSSLGLAPLVGNFYVMVWNFVTTLISIPLAYVFTMRQLFLFGSIFTSCMCMFLCGIPVYPGVSSRDAKDGVAITGIILYILGFEVCVGPCYYVLTQDMFPPSFRPRGASVTQVVQFIYNLIINVCYPIATERISGGRSGNQDKGQAIAFIFFGGLGFICFVIQVFFLHPWDEERDGKKNVDPETRKAEELLAQ